MSLSVEQYNYLIRPIGETRVKQLRGNAHLEAWDVRRYLIRIFGFDGWSTDVLECALVAEEGVDKGGRMGWTVVYRVQMRLTIYPTASADSTGRTRLREPLTSFEDGACGSASNQPNRGDAHDQALKTAMSQALKRCAINLGDQFGLGLYNDGSAAAVVGRSLVVPGAVSTAERLAELAAGDAPVELEPDSSLREPSPEPAGPVSQDVIDHHGQTVWFHPDLKMAAAAYLGAVTMEIANEVPKLPNLNNISTITALWHTRLTTAARDAKTLDEATTVYQAAHGSRQLDVVISDTGATLADQLKSKFELLRGIETTNISSEPEKPVVSEDQPMESTEVLAALGGGEIIEHYTVDIVAEG